MKPGSTQLTSQPFAGAALAFVRETPDEGFWSDVWARQSLEILLEVAEASELTRFLERHVGPESRVLEGGCGLGQYVRYFEARGCAVTGVDFSADAIEAHRSVFGDSNVLVGDLRRLPFDDGSFDVYLSLGVIEHYQDGGGDVLREAWRVLREDGVLLLSTPYINLTRRLMSRQIRREQTERAQQGGTFYQYAFNERTLDHLLLKHGFCVTSRSYYDPGRGLRDLRALVSRSQLARNDNPCAPTRAPRRHPGIKRAVLYSLLTLKLLAHMQIVRAEKVRAGH